MKKFFKNILLVTMPFIITVGIVNFLCHPSKTNTDGTYEEIASSILLKGHNIDNFDNCNERILTQKVVSKLPYQPDIVFLGSSRCLEISSEFAPSKKFFNASVSHANMYDVISLIGLLDSSNKLPKEIYIETNCTFYTSSDNNEWKSILPYFEFAKNKMELVIEKQHELSFITKSISKLKELFALEYFQLSIEKILEGDKKKKILDIGLNEPKGFGKHFDCSITYPISYTNVDTVKAIRDAPIFMSNNPLPIFCKDNIVILKKIVHYLKDKGVKVYLLNLPFQPDCYSFESNYNKIFGYINYRIISFCKENNLSLIGTFDPFEANLARVQFYDPLHCNKQALKTVMNIVKYSAKDSLK